MRAATHAAMAQPTRLGWALRHGSRRSAPGRGSRRAGSSARAIPAHPPGRRWTLSCGVPSGFSRRGTRSESRPGAARASSARLPSGTTQSGFSRTVAGCLARATPALLAVPKPGLPSSVMTSAPRSRAIAAPSSREPLSTTTTCGAGSRCASIESKSAGRCAAESWMTTTAVKLIPSPRRAPRAAGRPRRPSRSEPRWPPRRSQGGPGGRDRRRPFARAPS